MFKCPYSPYVMGPDNCAGIILFVTSLTVNFEIDNASTTTLLSHPASLCGMILTNAMMDPIAYIKGFNIGNC